MMFEDREHAGRLLGKQLERYRTADPLVLGLTRGGVPVAFEVARHLGAELDVLVVRKLSAPEYPEYAIGAIAEGGAVYLRGDALREVGLDEERIAELSEIEAANVARRARLFRGDRPLPELAGRLVIVVDDGVATGATAHVAARLVRSRGASRIVLAAPVIAAASEPELRRDYDEVVAIRFPESFFAVGQWYASFRQVADDEVLALLRRGRDATVAREHGAGEGTPPPRRDAVAPEAAPEEHTLAIPCERGELPADLAVPANARGLVVFVHGSGSTRRSPRNRYVARALQEAGFATVLFDLLTGSEAMEDEETAELRFDIGLLTRRAAAATRHLSGDPRIRELPLGYFGASTGAAAALAASAMFPDRVRAVVSRGGRPDLVAPEVLRRVAAAVLLIVGGSDHAVLQMNKAVLEHLDRAELAVIPGATHLFEEPGALDAVAGAASRWFALHLAHRGAAPHADKPR